MAGQGADMKLNNTALVSHKLTFSPVPHDLFLQSHIPSQLSIIMCLCCATRPTSQVTAPYPKFPSTSNCHTPSAWLHVCQNCFAMFMQSHTAQRSHSSPDVTPPPGHIVRILSWPQKRKLPCRRCFWPLLSFHTWRRSHTYFKNRPLTAKFLLRGTSKWSWFQKASVSRNTVYNRPQSHGDVTLWWESIKWVCFKWRVSE